MSMRHLKSLFQGQADVIAFKGKCHDCGKETQVVCELKDGEVTVYDGAYWHVDNKDFIKCLDCFEVEPRLTNFRRTEVYSRVTGYLTPTNRWHKGKQAEWAMRKKYNFNEFEKGEHEEKTNEEKENASD